MPASKGTIEQRVLAFIREHGLIAHGQRVLVGVSGGPDSVCLLHILHALKNELQIELHVAHLNHQLRGAESRADADYVARFARTLGIPATIASRDVKSYQRKNHLSLEEAAREVRYDLFSRTAKKVDADCVAVGHTTDDHIETMLMHLIRGAGINGLRGLLPANIWQREGNTITVIRPLLTITRQETAEYCREHHLEPRTDSTNISMSPMRNRIRLQLLPLLREYNPQVNDALLRTSCIAATDLDFLARETAKAWRKVAHEHIQLRTSRNNSLPFQRKLESKRRGSGIKTNVVTFDKAKFLKLAPAVQRELLLKGIEKTLGKLKDIELAHVEEMMDALSKPAGKQISLPQGLTFVIEYDRYLLGKDPAALSPFPPLKGEYKLNVPGKTVLPGWEITATVEKGGDGSPLLKGGARGIVPHQNNPSQSPFAKGRGAEAEQYTALFDLAQTGDELTVHPRRPGDRFYPLGLDAEKKLSQFMIDARIPHSWRERIHIVCSPNQILWVVGYRIDERVKGTEETKQMLKLEFRRV